MKSSGLRAEEVVLEREPLRGLKINPTSHIKFTIWDEYGISASFYLQTDEIRSFAQSLTNIVDGKAPPIFEYMCFA
jgi:hypothetical protein